jgi:hypothetical protein
MKQYNDGDRGESDYGDRKLEVPLRRVADGERERSDLNDDAKVRTVDLPSLPRHREPTAFTSHATALGRTT